jgi:uncharacterized membrane protein
MTGERHHFPGSGISIDAALKEGWELLGTHVWTYLKIGLAMGLVFTIGLIPSIVSLFVAEKELLLKFCLSFLGLLTTLLLSTVVEMMMIRTTINMARGDRVTIGAAFSDMDRYFWYLLAHCLFVSVRFIGLCFFIWPGILAHLCFQFVPYFVLDQRLGPIEAFKVSWRATRGVLLYLLIMALISNVIGSLGMFLLVIGVIPAYMLVSIITAVIYRQLADSSELPG